MDLLVKWDPIMFFFCCHCCLTEAGDQESRDERVRKYSNADFITVNVHVSAREHCQHNYYCTDFRTYK